MRPPEALGSLIRGAGELSETTVKAHVARVPMKLGVRDRVQAVIFAYENDIVAKGSGVLDGS